MVTYSRKNLLVKSNYIVFLYAFFIVSLILSNVAAIKITSILGIKFLVGLLFFPITYIVSDIVTEVYGFKESRKIIWCGFFANLIFFLGILFIAYLPTDSSSEQSQDVFRILSKMSPRILLASFIAYIFGEFANSYILSKLKIIQKGKRFEIRAVVSTLFGMLIDTFLFYFIVFLGAQETKIIMELIWVELVFKMGIEVVMLPLIKRATLFLKNKEQIDYYDYHTNYNPFVLKDN